MPGGCHVRSTRTLAVTRLRRPMTARATARRLVLQAALFLPVAAGASLLSPACYLSGAGGTDPPTETFYFPVGLAVSAGGNVLYVANSVCNTTAARSRATTSTVCVMTPRSSSARIS